MQSVKANPSLSIHVEQCLTPDDGLPESRLHNAGIGEVILALAPNELGVTADVSQVCEKCGTKTSVVAFYNDVMLTRPTIDAVGNLKLIQLRTTPLDEPVNALTKRAFDLVVWGFCWSFLVRCFSFWQSRSVCPVLGRYYSSRNVSN